MSCNLQGLLSQIHLLGISHKNTPLAIREKFYLTDVNQKKLLISAKKKGIEGIVCFSTCNRTEIYAYGNDHKFLEELLLKHTNGSDSELIQYGYKMQGGDVINHLYETSAGLNSQVIGDFQVMGQLRKAFKISEKLDSLNSFMNKLFIKVFQATKQIKNTTHLSKGASSIAHAAVLYIKEKQQDLENTKFLLYGLGSVGKVACSNLVKNMQKSNLVLINRSEEKAKDLAKKLDITYKNQKELKNEIDNAEVILVATGAKNYTLTANHFNNKKQNKLVFDLSVPRNVHNEIADIEGVKLVSIEDLTHIQDNTLERRRKSIPHAKKIIAESINEFHEWLELRYFSPIFQSLQKKLLQLKDDELTFHKNKLSPEEYQKFDAISTHLVKRISRITIKHIRQKAKTYSTALDTLQDFFEN